MVGRFGRRSLGLFFLSSSCDHVDAFQRDTILFGPGLPSSIHLRLGSRFRQRLPVSFLVSESPASEVLSPSPSERLSPTQPKECLCSFCGKHFSSKNNLFRHLKTEETCAARAGYDIISQEKELQTQRIALLVGYDFGCDDMNDSSANVAGRIIEDAFRRGLASKYRENDDSETRSRSTDAIQILSKSQTSVAKMRHRSLAQEAKCSAFGDVIVLSYNAPRLSQDLSNKARDSIRKRHVDEIIRQANDYLGKSRPSDFVTILSSCLLEEDSRLHAERGCSQRVYHYLMPLAWLPRGNEIAEWWLENQPNQTTENGSEMNSDVSSDNRRRRKRSFAGVKGEYLRAKTPPPAPSLRLIKEVLRQLESLDLNKDKMYDIKPDETRRNASGRFGLLATKERKCWHNYAAPKLAGNASPSHEPIWKALDRARIVDFFESETEDNEKDVIVVLEFRGEDFVEEQVRRLVGTAIAVSHGWLPKEFLKMSVCPSTCIETPLAPAGRLYFAGTRFLFEELANGGRNIFGDTDDDASTRWADNLRSRMLGRVNRKREYARLNDIEGIVCPRIRDSVEEIRMNEKEEEEMGPLRTSAPPSEYQLSLQLLRSILSSGKWPTTSLARSKIIQGTQNTHGSFTVLNPECKDKFAIPRANIIFPDLVKAVFDLENRLAEQIHQEDPSKQRRLPSSHCAVNACAKFAPHVDSGRGAGQSLSLIVGLGDYTGGDIVVENTSVDIRYSAHEFDGWRERHRTAKFQGERFSLVWFTPQATPINAIDKI